MRVRQGKPEAKLRLTKPRVFRQWKLGSEPPQFGDLSVTEAQIYLATGSDVEAIFLNEEYVDSPGFWARTDPVYDPHRLVTSADALNRPYIGMQIAIPAPWVEVTVRYSKQTAQTLAKLGRTGRRGYRAVEEQIRSRRERKNPADPDIATSCGCGFSDHHHADHDWIELPRILTSDGVLHVLRVWPVSACGQIDPKAHMARTFPPRQVLETEKPWRYCPRCWPIAKRRLLDLFREQMMGETYPHWRPGNDIPLPSIPMIGQADWLRYWRVLSSSRVVHVLPRYSDSLSDRQPACIANSTMVVTSYGDANYFPPETPIPLETDITYCPKCAKWIETSGSVVVRSTEPVTVRASETITSQVGMTQDSEGIPIILLTEPKTHLPEILQRCRLAGSRAQARTGINDGSVTIEGWPSIAHRHTFKSEDLNGKTLIIGGIPALRFTAQVSVEFPERTDS